MNTRTSTLRCVFGYRLRAAALAAFAIAAAALTWQLRPAGGLPADRPDTAVVTGCAWLAWGLAGYLAIAIAAAAISHLAGSAGAAAHALSRLTPATVRRVVDAAVSLGAVAAVVSSSTSVAAAASPVSHAVGSVLHDRAANRTAGSALDWPGLTKSTPKPRAETAPHQAAVVVRAGDTLWSIAARQLGGDPSAAAITAAWHAWYAANRDVIGANPSLIHPGQRLQPPLNTRS